MANAPNDEHVWMYLQNDGTWNFKAPEEKRNEKPANLNLPKDGDVWMYLQDDGTWDFKTPEEKRKEKPPPAPNGPNDGHVWIGRYFV
ncbi:hypothetical protein RUND412_006275 [Rhizina undulata]